MKLASRVLIKNLLTDKRGLELGPTTLLFLVILFAAGTAVMLIIMGKWLDLTGYRYKMETQRNAMNLVQLIVSNSPVVKVTDQPNKLILDAEKLDNYEEYAKIGLPQDEMTQFREKWEECCDFLEFDHNFTVHDIVTGKNWTIGNLVFKSISDCYPRRVQGFADLPVVISENGENHPGVAEVRLAKTPLSELSFWISQAFIRAYWDDYWNLFPEVNEYTVIVPLDGEVQKVSFSPSDLPKRVCTHLDKDGDGNIDIVVCKSLVSMGKTSSGNSISWNPKKDLPHEDCMNVLITVKRNRDSGNSEVIVKYPGG